MKNNLYLKEVNLSGYKSINDVNIEFLNGLNVIIGKNAAGKTNFLKFLNKLLNFNYTEINNFTSNLIFESDKKINIKTSRNIEIDEFFKNNNLSSKIVSQLKINNKIIKDLKGEESSIFEKFRRNNIVFENSFLCHGIPNEFWVVDKPFSFNYETNKGWSNDLHKIFGNTSSPYFVKYFTLDILLELMKMEDNFDENSVKDILINIFKTVELINQPIKKYTPIEDVRFSRNFNVFISENRESITVNNLFLEFKINGDWLPFSNLSDGTKRLFYIVSEVYDNEEDIHIRPTSVDRYTGMDQISRIILIEEPELGIHPHQFHKLMMFLNEESLNKQIIITTHSPQALDAIDPKELNRIIIAYSTDSKEGTKLRHLNDNELMKAKEYIKEDFLSDYWLYSNLEK